MSGFPSVEPLNVVPQKLLQPFKKDTANRMALSRVEMAENLLDRFGWFLFTLSFYPMKKLKVIYFVKGYKKKIELTSNVLFLSGFKENI